MLYNNEIRGYLSSRIVFSGTRTRDHGPMKTKLYPSELQTQVVRQPSLYARQVASC